ncbi:MAG: LysM peptidoglycan-binding domain-containing protein [Ardenticatenaceae bacterium]|nr:LysM peptidoglycan-binding domain-containing protein [Ardenticatenaceae bacterium]
MDVTWPLLVLGVLLALGFAALLWQRWAQGRSGTWRRPSTLYMDLVALVVTVVVVGALATTQLAAPPVPTPTPRPRRKAVVVPPSPTPSAVPTESPAPSATATVAVIPTATPSPVVEYTVQPGDTLLAIAARFAVTIEALRQANGLSSDMLQIGQVLVIPVPTPTAAPAAPAAEPPVATPTTALVTVGQPYTVQRGDTLNLIAQRFGVSVETILGYNPDIRPEALQIGQTIYIPVQVTATPAPPSPEPTAPPESTPSVVPAVPTAAPSATPTAVPPTPTAAPPTATPVPVQRYTVQPGDTLNLIAQRFGVTVDQILAANPGLQPEALGIGQEIIIPSGAAPAPQQPSAFQYTVQKGDTLNLIAQRFGVSVDRVLAANPGLVPSRLQIGQVILIPR